MADADRIAEEIRKLEVDLAYRDELARRIGLERQLGPAEARAEADARMSTLTDQIRRNRRSYALAQHHWWVQSALDQTEEELAKAPGLGTEPLLALSQLADLDGMNPSAEYLFATAATVLGDGSKLEEIAILATAIKTRVHAFLKARGHLWHQTIVKGPALFLEPRGREESRDAFFAKWAEEPSEKIEEKLSLGLTLTRADDGTWQPNITNGLLTVDQLLADLLEELGDKASAERMRASEFGETHVKIWRRWIPFRLVPELHGGPEAVAELGDKADMPPAVLAIATAVWKRIQAEREALAAEVAARAERLVRVPVPSLHATTAAVTLGLGRRLDTAVLRGTAAGIVAPPEPGRWTQLSETAGDTAGVLAAWLATIVHGQWLDGGLEMADRVEVVASKEQLAAMGLAGARGSPTAELEAALELLASVRLMGGDDDKQPGSGRLVLDYFKADKRWTTTKGGRPSTVYVVTVGWPLMPLRLEALAAERGFTIPRELAFYGPVLNPAWAPLTGNARTARTQRLAFAVGAGQWLVSRREEYAELGGVRLDTLRPFLRDMGLYHRSHASLADDVAAQWRTAPGQPPLPELGPKGPLLVPTLVDGVYQLGPDYKAQEALVLRNAELTAKARRAQRKGKRKP